MNESNYNEGNTISLFANFDSSNMARYERVTAKVNPFAAINNNNPTNSTVNSNTNETNGKMKLKCQID